MQISALFRLMGGDGATLLSEVQFLDRSQAIQEGLKQYDPKQHDVTSKAKRPDKEIMKNTGRKDAEGNDIFEPDLSPVARVPFAFQKYIIKQKAGFARGNGVTLKPSIPDETVFDLVYNNWYKNKTDFIIGEIAKRKMSETQVAVIYYSYWDTPGNKPDPNRPEKLRLKRKVVSPAKGDTLVPIFDDDTDDMIGFGRGYEVGDKSMYDLYLMNAKGKAELRRYENGAPDVMEIFNDAGEVTDVAEFIVELPYTKLPVVYWEQDLPECDDVSELINELEFQMSDFFTQQSYSADPILFGKGETIDMPAAGESGKYIQGSGDADLKYITPENATESRELQFKTCLRLIQLLTKSAFIDLETMKDLRDVSGVALQRFLIDVYQEARDNQQGPWGMGIQRMVNFELSVYSEFESPSDENFGIDVVFSTFSIDDVKERIEQAMLANGGLPVVSHIESIRMAGIEDDATEALDIITGQNNDNNQ